MAASVTAIPTPEEFVNQWLESLEADDYTRGTIRQYKSAALSFIRDLLYQELRETGE